MTKLVRWCWNKQALFLSFFILADRIRITGQARLIDDGHVLIEGAAVIVRRCKVWSGAPTRRGGKGTKIRTATSSRPTQNVFIRLSPAKTLIVVKCR